MSECILKGLKLTWWERLKLYLRFGTIAIKAKRLTFPNYPLPKDPLKYADIKIRRYKRERMDG